MSLSNDKALKSVAEAVSKIMEASAKKADKDYDQDGKIESPKAEVLGSRIRAAKAAGKLKEDAEEQIDEASYSAKAARAGEDIGKPGKNFAKIAAKAGKKYDSAEAGKRVAGAVLAKLRKEETELDEAFPTVDDAKKRMDAGKTATGSVTKTKTGLVHKRDYKDDDNDADDTQKPKKGYGARQNYKRSTRVNESMSFTEMLELYNEHGLKVLKPIEKEEIEVEGNTIEVIDADKINGYVETVVEEADEAEFNKDLEKNKAKAAGKAKQPDLAKGDVQAVKNEGVEQLDELSIDTLKSYRKKAKKDMYKHFDKFHGYAHGDTDDDQRKAIHHLGKEAQREVGRDKAKIKIKQQKANLKKEDVEQMDEVAPPGREKQVKALKKVPGIDNPWAVSWASYRKSHPKKKD